MTVAVLPAQGISLTLDELIAAYMAGYRGRDMGRLSLLAYIRTQPIAAKSLDAIDADDVEQALDHYRASPARTFVGHGEDRKPLYRERSRTPSNANASVNRLRSTLSALFRYAREVRVVPRGFVNPVREIPTLREENRRIVRLNRRQREALLASARVCGWNLMPLLVAMALCSGARKSELLGLRGRDLDLHAGLAHVSGTKNGDDRALTLDDEVVAKLRAMRVKDDALVFPSRRNPARPIDIRKPWARTTTGAKCGGLPFHGLRHACASALAEAGASTVIIASTLGHRSLEMAKRYSHLSRSAEREWMQRAQANLR